QAPATFGLEAGGPRSAAGETGPTEGRPLPQTDEGLITVEARAVPIRVGTAGWAYEDWNAIVYPERPGRGFDRLGLMASLFDTNEINSTFYRIPLPPHHGGLGPRG